MAAAGGRQFFGPERTLAFSDGVFAVAITLLVIDLRLPALGSAGSDAVMRDALLSMGPKLLIFGFTFLIVGMSWLGHHLKFTYIRQVDNGLLWLNLIYLMALCLVPFATSVLSEHGGRYSFIFYAGVMALVSLLSAALAAYGLREPFLASELGTAMRQDMILSPLATGAIFLIAGAIALGGRLMIARWVLLLIVPVSAFFGRRARKPG